MAAYAEQRRAARVVFHAPTVLQWQGEGKAGSGTVSNISKFGCYVLTQSPALSGEHIRIRMNGGLPEIECLVRYTDPHVGMGVEFTGLQRETELQITDLIRAKGTLP